MLLDSCLIILILYFGVFNIIPLNLHVPEFFVRFLIIKSLTLKKKPFIS